MTDKKHDATHALDRYCTMAMQGLNEVFDSAEEIGANDELRAVFEAVQKLHKAANQAHILLFAECGAAS